MNKTIWFFREPRSGSMWALNALHVALNKEQFIFDPKINSGLEGKSGYNKDNLIDSFLKIKHELCNSGNIYSSHYFFLLPYLSDTDGIFLLRSTRRNSLEQILSLIYREINRNGLHHYYVDNSKNLSMNHFLKTLENPVIVTKKQVFKEYVMLQNMNKLWNEYSKKFSNFTIYYEDLNEGIDIPDLKIRLAFDLYSDYMNKTPEYKSKVFTNYDQITEWYKEFENKHGPIKG